MELTGDHVAIVTGGASGLGEATVRRLSAAGVHVVVADLNKDRGDALVEQLGARATMAPTDVTDEDAVSDAVRVAQERGELRVCVNAAGIGVPPARTVARDHRPHSMEAFRRAVEVNLCGTFNVTRLAAAAMASLDPVDEDGQRGVVVNTASLAAFDGQVGQVAYAASKAGVAGMTLPLARDLAVLGVRVCTIAPGVFDTPIFGTDEAAKAEFQDQLVRDNLHPRRLGFADEFADLVHAIIGNDMLNAETIRIDGGARLRPNPRSS